MMPATINTVSSAASASPLSPLSVADLHMIETLHRHLLGEMERMSSEEAHSLDLVISQEQMSHLSQLCFQAMHYLLITQAPDEEIVAWVEEALDTLRHLEVIDTPHAQRPCIEWSAAHREAAS
jgi:hypothetical protein